MAHRLTIGERDEIVKRYLDGESTPKLATAFGCAVAIVRRELKRRGVHLRHGWAKVPEYRRCRKCHEDKPIGAFVTTGKTGAAAYTYHCRECFAKYCRDRNYGMKWRSGLTAEQYDELLKRQHGCCAICRKPPKRNRLHVDHDHQTEVIRGLLCTRCNHIMASIDDTDWLKRAFEYQLFSRTEFTWNPKGKAD